MKWEYIRVYIQYMRSPKGAYEWQSYGYVIIFMLVITILMLGAWLYEE